MSNYERTTILSGADRPRTSPFEAPAPLTASAATSHTQRSSETSFSLARATTEGHGISEPTIAHAFSQGISERTVGHGFSRDTSPNI